MSQPPLDINHLAQSDRYNVELRTEDPVVRDARLKEAQAEADAVRRRADADAAIRRRTGVVTFALVALGVVAIACFCGFVIISSQYLQEEKKWAMGVISTIIAGFLGYLIGKK